MKSIISVTLAAIPAMPSLVSLLGYDPANAPAPQTMEQIMAGPQFAKYNSIINSPMYQDAIARNNALIASMPPGWDGNDDSGARQRQFLADPYVGTYLASKK